MPQGDKSAYTSKQKRQARDIEKSYEKRGVSIKESERRAWATVNKLTGGGLKEISGEANSAKTGQGKKVAAKKMSAKGGTSNKPARKNPVAKKSARSTAARSKAASKSAGKTK